MYTVKILPTSINEDGIEDKQVQVLDESSNSILPHCHVIRSGEKDYQIHLTVKGISLGIGLENADSINDCAEVLVALIFLTSDMWAIGTSNISKN